MRSNRLLVGVTCGVALALGVLAAVDAGTQTAGADPNVTEDQLAPGQAQLWVSLNNGGTISFQSRSESPASDRFTSTRGTDADGNLVPAGFYVVNFKRSVAGCSWTATPRTTTNRFAVTAVVQGEPTQVGVRVYTVPTVPRPEPPAVAAEPVLTDSFVDVQVLC